MTIDLTFDKTRRNIAPIVSIRQDISLGRRHERISDMIQKPLFIRFAFKKNLVWYHIFYLGCFFILLIMPFVSPQDKRERLFPHEAQ